MISLKKCGEIAVSIFVKCVTIIQIIFLFLLINYILTDKGLLNEPMMAIVNNATFQQWNFKIPPLIVMIAINVCLIFCTKMGKIPSEYWQWKKDKAGIFLIMLNFYGYLVSKITMKYFLAFWKYMNFIYKPYFFSSLALWWCS